MAFLTWILAAFLGLSASVSPTSAKPGQAVFPLLRGPFLGQSRPEARPVVFAAGIVDSTPVFSPDGREACWTRPEGPFRSVIVSTRLVGGAWTEPAPLPFSKPEGMDHNPCFSGDGRALVFAASRPIPGRPRTFIEGSPMPASDIWIVRRDDAGRWGDPAFPGPSVNTEYDEDNPRMAADGTIYFTSGKPHGDGYAGICRARLSGSGYADPEILPIPPNSKHGEIVEAVAPDQGWLLFRSLRPGGFGRADVYASFSSPDGAWSEPLNLGAAFNQPRRWALHFSGDGRFLFYTSDGEGKARVYWVEAPRLADYRRPGAGSLALLR